MPRHSRPATGGVAACSKNAGETLQNRPMLNGAGSDGMIRHGRRRRWLTTWTCERRTTRRSGPKSWLTEHRRPEVPDWDRQPHNPPQGEQDTTDWSDLLNRHHLPRGSIPPRPHTTTITQPAAAGQTRAARTTAANPPQEPRRRRQARPNTTATQDHNKRRWEGVLNTMLQPLAGSDYH